MWRAGVVTLGAALLCLNAAADACVPLLYDTTGITAPRMAQALVREARSVELMRVVSRQRVATDSIILEYYGPVYAYRLESVAVLNGRRRRRLELYGLDPHWIEERLPDFPRHEPAPLDWTTQRGYERLQETRFPDPSESASVACAAVTTFELGAEYLVFRDASGALLAPAFEPSGYRSVRRHERPILEHITGPNDPWLREVRVASGANPKSGATFWELVFELIFGNRRREGSA